ncbi:MAG: macro domain-containing protein, partial [Chloroflexi bacterium]|nr:macro domain-containing protein [Chloroflexota bacterium]
MDIKRNYDSPFNSRLEVGQGDITSEKVDAIVNAANSRLNHGGGVARAIAERGGSVITDESRKWVETNGPVTHDSPAYTRGGDLPCKFVIHAVGPVWGEGDEEKKLTSTIWSCLELAESLGVKTIAFPAISTGIFGFPVQNAAKLFMTVFKDFLSTKRPG